MTKFFLGLAIVAFTSFCGYLFAKKYRQRKQFFSQWKEFNERFLNEISYYRRPLIEFVFKYPYKGEFNKLLERFFQTIDDRTLFLGIIYEKNEYAFLSQEEKGMIEDYFMMLGKGDSASQKAYFSALKEPIGKMQSGAETAYKKYGDLYVKLGFLCGLLILILLL